MVKARDVSSFRDLDFFGTFFQDGINFHAFFTSPRLKCSRKKCLESLKNFSTTSRRKRSVVASFQIFLGTLGNFSIYL
jgi:hypothetical protein